MVRRIFEPPFCDLVLPLVLRDVDSGEQPRRERSGADVAVVVVDLEEVETAKIEAGSGIKSSFPCDIFSSAWVPLDCDSGDCGCSWDSDSERIIGVDVADGTGEVDDKEPEERRNKCSGVDALVNGTTAARDISSPRGGGGAGGCDTLVFGVGGACESGM